MQKERFYVQCGVYNFKLSASAQCIYFYLCKCADKGGSCFPGREKIHRETGLALSTISRSIKELKIKILNENDDLIIGFKGILNDFYAKDISRKVRAGFRQKQKEGIVMIPPMGYFKDKNTGEIIIEGFRLGARFGMEIADKPNSCFVDVCE